MVAFNEPYWPTIYTPKLDKYVFFLFSLVLDRTTAHLIIAVQISSKQTWKISKFKGTEMGVTTVSDIYLLIKFSEKYMKYEYQQIWV